MSSFPRSPRVHKGAVVALDPANPLASVVVFQYNPETLTRTLTAQTSGGGAPGEALRLEAPPREQIRADVELDATDQLEAGDAQAEALGLHPQLAALEMLLYPKSALVVANEVLKLFGAVEVVAPQAPLTLFAWGARRVLPVRLTGLGVTEEAFDAALNPIHASVSLTMDVLSYHDLGPASVGGALSLAHQVAKEALATANGAAQLASGASALVTGLPF